MIDLTDARIDPRQVDHLVQSCAYQPYRMPGSTVTGAGLAFVKATDLRHASESTDHPDRDLFLKESANQAAMYEQFLAYAGSFISSENASFLDVACNSGYFCYRMSQRGASRSVGVDVGDFAQTFDIINGALGTAATFLPGHYDMRKHELVGVGDEQFDVVFNTAFMCHSSDPTFLLEALAKRARKALLVFSKFSRDDNYVVRYSKTTSRYFMQPYPLCFDAATEISDSLLLFALDQLGFSRVYEVPRKPTWLPRSPEWRAFLALR